MVNADASDRLNLSQARDTCPDLSLASARGPCTWTNLQESLGSDHFIIEIQVQVQAHRRQKKALRLVNWDSFRQLRAQTNAEEIDEDVPFAQWAALSSAKPEDQRMLISRDKRIAEANGALD
ncbi:hypothetical protein HPB47_004914 [Ixodes persulcatus]|uniref:Uncharacterized protein n=1 Tax=Ixodes persulcatus TaxID=34615 RepID=A0AC60PEE7_IXOPE|nr:hypothetical protein HPB47_004914 [Ixodes persulcatus]